jgi:hypothetical protein
LMAIVFVALIWVRAVLILAGLFVKSLFTRRGPLRSPELANGDLPVSGSLAPGTKDRVDLPVTSRPR